MELGVAPLASERISRQVQERYLRDTIHPRRPSVSIGQHHIAIVTSLDVSQACKGIRDVLRESHDRIAFLFVC